jgi:hypothetical protein
MKATGLRSGYGGGLIGGAVKSAQILEKQNLQTV